MLKLRFDWYIERVYHFHFPTEAASQFLHLNLFISDSGVHRMALINQNITRRRTEELNRSDANRLQV